MGGSGRAARDDPRPGIRTWSTRSVRLRGLVDAADEAFEVAGLG